MAIDSSPLASGHRPWVVRTFKALAYLGLLGLAVYRLAPLVSGPAERCPVAVPRGYDGGDGLGQFVQRYGRPWLDHMTTFQRGPEVVTMRILTYREQGVRALFLPKGHVDSALTPAAWDLLVCQEYPSRRMINDEELDRRMAAGHRALDAVAQDDGQGVGAE